MKFSIVAVFALAGSALCSPYAVAAPDDQAVAQASTILNQLYSQIQQVSGQINQTVDSISASSSKEQRSSAEQTIAADIGKLTQLVDAAKNQVSAIKKSGSGTTRIVVADPTKDPKAAALAGLAGNVLLTLQGTINKVQGKFGDSPVISVQINKLVSSVSGLLLSLRDVLDNVLELVKELLDGLLTGLSGGLTILTLPKGLVGGLGKGLAKLPGYLGSLLTKGKGGAGALPALGLNGTANATAPVAQAAAPVAQAAAPVAQAAAPVAALASNATSTLGNATAPIAGAVAPVAGAVAPVASAVGNAAAPVASAVNGVFGGLTGAVGGAAGAPGAVDPSRAPATTS